MKTTILILAFALTGCARFVTRQTDVSPDRTITTTAKATTFFEGKSALTAFKATQTDKSQSATVGSLNQEATSTNATAIVGAVIEAAIKAAAKSVVP